MTRLPRVVVGWVVASMALIALSGCDSDEDPDSPSTPQAKATTCLEAVASKASMHVVAPDGFARIEGEGGSAQARLRRAESKTEVSMVGLRPFSRDDSRDDPDQELILRGIASVGVGWLSGGPAYTQAAADLEREQGDEVQYETPNPMNPDQPVSVYATLRQQGQQRFVLALFAPSGEKFTEVKAKALATLATGSCPKD